MTSLDLINNYYTKFTLVLILSVFASMLCGFYLKKLISYIAEKFWQNNINQDKNQIFVSSKLGSGQVQKKNKKAYDQVMRPIIHELNPSCDFYLILNEHLILPPLPLPNFSSQDLPTSDIKKQPFYYDINSINSTNYKQDYISNYMLLIASLQEYAKLYYLSPSAKIAQDEFNNSIVAAKVNADQSYSHKHLIYNYIERLIRNFYYISNIKLALINEKINNFELKDIGRFKSIPNDIKQPRMKLPRVHSKSISSRPKLGFKLVRRPVIKH